VRRTGIGGSDVAAILGMDRRRGPLAVYLSKRGEAPPERSARLNRSARRGHRLEGLVAEFFAEETGLRVLDTPGTLRHVDRPWMLANPDRIVLTPGDTAGLASPHNRVLECKTRTWRSARSEDWGGEEPPDGPALQAYWYQAVTGYRGAYVAGLIDDDLTVFELADDPDLIDHLVTFCERWWHDHVAAGVPPAPDGSKATAELLSRLWEVDPEAVAEVDADRVIELVAHRDRLSEEADRIGAEITRTDNELRSLLGDAEVGADRLGRTLLTWRQNGTFAPARFADAHPDIVAAHQRQTTVPDWDAIKTAHPDEYRAHRARVLRISKDARP
jgi:predicted phage-related endonuclease